MIHCNKRPKIGLTLSGGGAKGLAHIGILKAIDSAGLSIDYITGTSMGSIIGSFMRPDTRQIPFCTWPGE